jgi:hypothetical protein
MNPWQALPESAPYVLPVDQAQVERFNQSAALQHRLRLEVVPEPFPGNPLAPVVLLNGNPGFSESDTAVHLSATFNRAARANLLHRNADWPLYLLDPVLPSSGHDWWSRRLRPLAEAAGGYQRVARSVFVAETHGYHAVKYRRIRLPSQQYTRDLVGDAISRNAVFIIMRARREWYELMPELNGAQVFFLQSPQNVIVSPGNCPDGFKRAVKAIRAAG